ncbi:MAG TPA: hypothetical protein VLL97_08245 [Acidobacteriota bacterium]|nr:hypothetical protein [Acidobacteriota bacterium]
MASFEIVQLRAYGMAVLKQSLGKYSMDDLRAARTAIKCWCKIVTSTAAKKRRDDVGDVPIFYLFSKAGFPPYLVSLFV